MEDATLTNVTSRPSSPTTSQKNALDSCIETSSDESPWNDGLEPFLHAYSFQPDAETKSLEELEKLLMRSWHKTRKLARVTQPGSKQPSKPRPNDPWSLEQNQPLVLQNQPLVLQNQPLVVQNQPLVVQNQSSEQSQSLVVQNQYSEQNQSSEQNQHNVDILLQDANTSIPPIDPQQLTSAYIQSQRALLQQQLAQQQQILSMLQTQQSLLSSSALSSEELLAQHEQLLKSAQEAILTQQKALESVLVPDELDTDFVERQVKQHEEMMRAASILKQQQQFLTNQSHFLDTKKEDANGFVRIGNDLKDAAKFVEAAQAYSSAIECEPRNPFLWYLRAVAWENIPDWPRAVADLDQLMKLVEEGGRRGTMSFKAAGSGGDMLITPSSLWLMSIGFRAVAKEEMISSSVKRDGSVDPEMLRQATDDVRLFLAAYKSLEDDDGVFYKYMSAYRRGRVLVSRKKIRFVKGDILGSLSDTLEVLKKESRSDFYEFGGDCLRYLGLWSEAGRMYTNAAVKNRTSGSIRLKHASCLARAGRNRDAWYSFEDVQKRFVRGDLAKDVQTMHDLFEYLDGAIPGITVDMTCEDAFKHAVAYLFKVVNGDGTVLGEPGPPPRKKKSDKAKGIANGVHSEEKKKIVNGINHE